MVNILIIGVVLSLLFYELTEISPGGIIVPGLMVLYIHRIDWMIYTVLIAIATYLIVRLLSRYFIIFGRRRFALMIIISLLIHILLSLVIGWLPFAMIGFSIVGYTIAGIIANDIEKQGMVKTIPALTVVVGLLYLIVLFTQMVGI